MYCVLDGTVCLLSPSLLLHCGIICPLLNTARLWVPAHTVSCITPQTYLEHNSSAYFFPIIFLNSLYILITVLPSSFSVPPLQVPPPPTALGYSPWVPPYPGASHLPPSAAQ